MVLAIEFLFRVARYVVRGVNLTNPISEIRSPGTLELSFSISDLDHFGIKRPVIGGAEAGGLSHADERQVI
jgi:hypothetical protein